jgi:hypothetical protein
MEAVRAGRIRVQADERSQVEQMTDFSGQQMNGG